MKDAILILASAIVGALLSMLAVNDAFPAVPHPDRPMALSRETPLILKPVPIKDVDPTRCTGTTRIIEAEEGRPVVIEVAISCE